MINNNLLTWSKITQQRAHIQMLLYSKYTFLSLYICFWIFICFTLNSSCFISPMYHVAWHRLLRVMTDSTTKSVQTSITMTHEFHNEHKQIYFDQESREFQAKTFKKKDTFIFGMGIQPCSLSTHLPLLYQHVLDARQGNMILPVMKDSKGQMLTVKDRTVDHTLKNKDALNDSSNDAIEEPFLARFSHFCQPFSQRFFKEPSLS